MAWGQIAFWTPSNEHTALQLSLYVHFDEHPRYSPKVCEKLQPLFDTYYKTMVWHTEPTLRISYLSGAFFAISKTHLGQAIGPEGIENKWPERSLYRYLFWLHAFCFPLKSHLEKIRSGPETKGNKTFKSLNLGACLIPMYSWNAFLVLPKTQTRHCAMVWCQMRSEPNQKRPVLQLSLSVHFGEHPRYSPKVCKKLEPLFDTYYKTLVWHTEPALRIS